MSRHKQLVKAIFIISLLFLFSVSSYCQSDTLIVPPGIEKKWALNETVDNINFTIGINEGADTLLTVVSQDSAYSAVELNLAKTELIFSLPSENDFIGFYVEVMLIDESNAVNNNRNGKRWNQGNSLSNGNHKGRLVRSIYYSVSDLQNLNAINNNTVVLDLGFNQKGVQYKFTLTVEHSGKRLGKSKSQVQTL